LKASLSQGKSGASVSWLKWLMAWASPTRPIYLASVPRLGVAVADGEAAVMSGYKFESGV
jgi:hypothetical protein